MKKGFLSPFHQGSLNAISEALKIAAKHTKEGVTNTDAIFYAAAFQAGIDEFLVYEGTRDEVTTRSAFIASRTKTFTNNRSTSHFNVITNAFSVYLPNDWRISNEYHPVVCTAIFINDLLDAMSVGASLLLTGKLPDMVEIKELMPEELFVPLSTFLSTFTAVQTPSPIPQNALLRDDIQKYNEILSSDLFSKYVNSQSSLDDSGIPIEKTLPAIASDGRMLFSHNRNLLALRNASVNILQMTPKLVEAVFGKLPGALAEVAAKLGISFLEARRRLVIYDFHKLMYEEVLMANLVRMLKKASEAEEGSG